MKRLRYLLPALGLCLLLAGCDLRNRQSSENFVPGQTGLPAQTEAPVTDSVGGESPVQTGNNPVKTALSAKGEADFVYPALAWSYELPWIDLPDRYAMECSQEIDLRFGAPIREAMADLEQYKLPVVQKVAYQAYSVKGILTLRIERTNTDGTSARAIYSVMEQTGARVTTSDFCEAAGIPQKELLSRLNQAVEEKLLELCQGRWTREDTPFRTALTLTLSRLAEVDRLNLYLSPEGRLIAVVEVFDPAGGSTTEEIPIGTESLSARGNRMIPCVI